jgi:hypothetical protein
VDGADGGAHLKKILRISAGVGLILIGIVGLILPVMPGWIFIIPGLVILAEYSKSARRLLDWLKEKFEEARTAAGGKPSPPPDVEP